MPLSIRHIRQPQVLKKEDKALGRSRGGYSTKVHLLCCGRGFPLQVSLSGGQAAEGPHLISLLNKDTNKPKVIVADKGFDGQHIRKQLHQSGIRAQIAERALAEDKKRRRKGRKPKVDKQLYSKRNIIERLFGKLKEMRRFDKLQKRHLAFIHLAFIKVYLKPYFSDTA